MSGARAARQIQRESHITDQASFGDGYHVTTSACREMVPGDGGLGGDPPGRKHRPGRAHGRRAVESRSSAIHFTSTSSRSHWTRASRLSSSITSLSTSLAVFMTLGLSRQHRAALPAAPGRPRSRINHRGRSPTFPLPRSSRLLTWNSSTPASTSRIRERAKCRWANSGSSRRTACRNFLHPTSWTLPGPRTSTTLMATR